MDFTGVTVIPARSITGTASLRPGGPAPGGERPQDQRPSAAPARRPADLRRGERAVADHDLQGDLARPPHLVALLDHEGVLAVPERLALHQDAGEGRGGGAR